MRGGQSRAAAAAAIVVGVLLTVAPAAATATTYKSLRLALDVTVDATPSAITDATSGVPDYDALTGSLQLSSRLNEFSVSPCLGKVCPLQPYDMVGTTSTRLTMSTDWTACRQPTGPAVPCASADQIGTVEEQGKSSIHALSDTRVRDPLLVHDEIPATDGAPDSIILTKHGFVIGLAGLHALVPLSTVSGSRSELVMCPSDPPNGAAVGAFDPVGVENYDDGQDALAETNQPCPGSGVPAVPDPVPGSTTSKLYIDPGAIVAGADDPLCPSGLGPIAAALTFGQSPQLCGSGSGSKLPSGTHSTPITFATPPVIRAAAVAGETPTTFLESTPPMSDALGVVQGDTPGMTWSGTMTVTYKVTGGKAMRGSASRHRERRRDGPPRGGDGYSR